MVQASVKLVFGKKIGATKVFSNIGDVTSQPLIWNKDANMLLLTEPADGNFSAGDITDYETQIVADGYPQAYADSSKVKFDRLLPVYFDPVNATLQTAQSLLYRRRISQGTVDPVDAPNFQTRFTQWVKQRIFDLVGTYELLDVTTTEGSTFQNAVRNQIAGQVHMDEIEQWVADNGGEIMEYPSTGGTNPLWPGCFTLIYTYNNFGGADGRSTVAETKFWIKPPFFDSHGYSNPVVQLFIDIDAAIRWIEWSTDTGDGLHLNWTKVNWNDNRNTTWHLNTSVDPGAPAHTPAPPYYSYLTDAGAMTEELAMSVIEKSGLSRELVAQISAYLMDRDGQAVNNSSQIPDIGYWLYYATKTVHESNSLGGLAYDPVNDWSAYNYEVDMIDKFLVHLGWVPSYSSYVNGPVNVEEIIMDGFKQTAESSVPLFVMSRNAPRTYPAARPVQIDAWFYRTGDEMEQAFRDLKVAQGSDFPSEVTEAHFVEVGERDYFFMLCKDFTIADAAWSKSRYNGMTLDGVDLTADTTFVGEDESGDPIPWDDAKPLLTTNGCVSALGALFILPFDAGVTAIEDLTVDIDPDGSIDAVTPASTITIDYVKALVSVNHPSLTLDASAALVSHYGNAANAAYYAEYEAGSRKGTNAMLAEYVFRKANGMSYGIDLQNTLVFSGLSPQSYYTRAAPYTKTGATRNFPFVPKITGQGSIGELAMIQAPIDKAARGMLCSIAQVGMSLVHGL
jgi:hypothetical protein